MNIQPEGLLFIQKKWNAYEKFSIPSTHWLKEFFFAIIMFEIIFRIDVFITWIRENL